MKLSEFKKWIEEAKEIAEECAEFEGVCVFLRDTLGFMASNAFHIAFSSGYDHAIYFMAYEDGTYHSKQLSGRDQKSRRMTAILFFEQMCLTDKLYKEF